MVQELTGTTMSHSIESLGTGQEHGRSPQASTTARWLPMRSLDNSHRTEVCKHLLALSPADRLLRFAHAATDEQIEHYCAQIDFLHDELFGVFDRHCRRLRYVMLLEDALSLIPHLTDQARQLQRFCLHTRISDLWPGSRLRAHREVSSLRTNPG